MLTVNEISESANVTRDAIRHYVRIGLLKPKRNPSNNYKLFGSEDIKIVKFICQAKELGFTLRNIETIISHSNKGKSPCPTVRKIIQKRISDNRGKLAELINLQERMEQALLKWKDMPDGEPDGNAICWLIDTVSTSTNNEGPK